MSRVIRLRGPFASAATTLVLWCSAAQAQSPYGLGARQTIPFVVDLDDDRGPIWNTEINVHNPGSLPVTVLPTYFPISQNVGAVSCLPITVAPGGTVEARLHTLCNTPFGLNYGRLELSSLQSVNAGEPDDAGSRIFLATGRVSQLGGRLFTVEGFRQGQLSGNARFAAVSGLKRGLLGTDQWQTDCFAAALSEPVPVFVRLVDGSGLPIGNFASAAIDPNLGIEGAQFPDVFTKVGAPPGNYSNVTALFSTAAQGGVGGAGVFGFCQIVNISHNTEAFEIAKYLDNNDDARQYVVSVSETRAGSPFGIVSEIEPNSLLGESNLHIAYFEHPDRVTCSVRFTTHPPNLAVFDLGQIRLIDPDNNIVAGGLHAQSFSINLREKSVHNNGRNGRWIIEVAPDHAIKEGGGLFKGGLDLTEYVLTCSTGNGVNQLDIGGHCPAPCAKGGGKGNDLFCTFVTPFPKGCGY
jgi:hypothetical protein